MAPPTAPTPGLHTFLKSLKQDPIGKSVYLLASLIQRRQITDSKACAVATTQLLLRVVADFRDKDVWVLFERIREIGRLLVDSQPQAFVIGNIVRRTLSLVREIAEDRQQDGRLNGPAAGRGGSNKDGAGADPHFSTGPVVSTSLFELFSHPVASPTTQIQVAMSNLQLRDGKQQPAASPSAPAPVASPALTAAEAKAAKYELRADVLDGMRELLDEIEQVDEQVASYSTDHIHSNETILVQGASMMVQKFLLTAARKRKFTVIQVESYPAEHDDARSIILNGQHAQAAAAAEDGSGTTRAKPLTAAGITVITVPDSAVFALMSRVNKVILAPNAVLANGGLIASAGAHAIALAAQSHKVPVVALSGVFKLSPVYPFMTETLVTAGDGRRVVEKSGLPSDGSDVVSMLTDFVPPDLVDLYITNLGGHAPSYLYRIVADHYNDADLIL